MSSPPPSSGGGGGGKGIPNSFPVAETGIFDGPKKSISGGDDLSNRNKLGSMMAPGSTLSHTLVKADDVQKAVMENKFRGLEEYDPHNEHLRRRYKEYDTRPEVVERRWENMTWKSRLTVMDPNFHSWATHLFVAFMATGFARLWYTTTMRSAIAGAGGFCMSYKFHKANGLA